MPTTMFDPRMDVNGQVAFKGEFNKVSVYQNPVIPGNVSNMVIDYTQPFTIDLEWQIEGNLFYVNSVLNAISPKFWYVHLYAEIMGPGDDIEIYTGQTPAGSITNLTSQAELPKIWRFTCTLPFGPPPHDLPKSGMYKLCVVIHANSTMPGGSDIIGCNDGPMVLFEIP